MHNFYLSRKKRGISTSSLYNYYFFSWRIFVSRIEIYIWANIIWKIPLETSPAGIASPLLSLWCREHLRDDNKAAGENSQNTWEKLRFGRAARQKNSRFSSGNPSEQSLSLFFSFLCCQITGIQSFHLWQIFIRGASHPSPPLLVVTAFVSKLLNYTLPR